MRFSAVIRYYNYLRQGETYMTYQVKRSDLNQEKYSYKWSVDSGDDPNYTGSLDRAKIDKDEGYEVKHMIQRIYNQMQWSKPDMVSQVEDYIHSRALQDIQSSDRIFTYLTNRTYNISSYLR